MLLHLDEDDPLNQIPLQNILAFPDFLKLYQNQLRRQLTLYFVYNHYIDFLIHS